MGTSFRYIVPSGSSEITIVSGFSSSSTVEACGRSILILCASSGAVIMKMISSTSMTSTSGVVLISAIGVVWGWPLPPSPLNAMAFSVPSGCLLRVRAVVVHR